DAGVAGDGAVAVHRRARTHVRGGRDVGRVGDPAAAVGVPVPTTGRGRLGVPGLVAGRDRAGDPELVRVAVVLRVPVEERVVVDGAGRAGHDEVDVLLAGLGLERDGRVGRGEHRAVARRAV